MLRYYPKQLNTLSYSFTPHFNKRRPSSNEAKRVGWYWRSFVNLIFVDEDDEHEDVDQKRLTKVESDNELVLFLIL